MYTIMRAKAIFVAGTMLLHYSDAAADTQKKVSPHGKCSSCTGTRESWGRGQCYFAFHEDERFSVHGYDLGRKICKNCKFSLPTKMFNKWKQESVKGSPQLLCSESGLNKWRPYTTANFTHNYYFDGKHERELLNMFKNTLQVLIEKHGDYTPVTPLGAGQYDFMVMDVEPLDDEVVRSVLPFKPVLNADRTEWQVKPHVCQRCLAMVQNSELLNLFRSCKITDDNALKVVKKQTTYNKAGKRLQHLLTDLPKKFKQAQADEIAYAEGRDPVEERRLEKAKRKHAQDEAFVKVTGALQENNSGYGGHYAPRAPPAGWTPSDSENRRRRLTSAEQVLGRLLR